LSFNNWCISAVSAVGAFSVVSAVGAFSTV